MKKISLFFIIFISFAANAKVLDEKAKPLPEVIKIFRHLSPILKDSKKLSKERLEVILNDPDTSKIALSELNELAQEYFKRPFGIERRDIAEFNKKFIPYDNEAIRALFRELGDIDEVLPSKKPIHYVFLNGSTVKNMRERIMFFVKLYQQHQVHLSPGAKIIFLTGDRALYPEEDKKLLWDPFPYKIKSGWQASSKIPKNEFEAAKLIWEQLDIPKAIRRLPISFVNAPKPKILQDGLARPHTYDTIIVWIQQNPNAQPGHCLSVSNNPYIYYQQLTLENAFRKTNLLKKGFTIEATGAAAEYNIKLALLLDNLARVIYLETQKQIILDKTK